MKKKLKIAFSFMIAVVVCATTILPAFALSPVNFGTMKTKIGTQSYEYGDDAVNSKILDGLEVQGKVGEQWYSSTFGNRGFHVFLNTGSTGWVMNGRQEDSEANKGKAIAMSYVFNTTNTIPQTFDGLTLDVATLKQGNFLKLQYTVKNTTSAAKTYSLATTSDVEVAGNDDANLDIISNGKSIKMVNIDKKVVFVVDSALGTPVDNAWVGPWDNDYFVHMFDDCEDNASYTEGDSAACFSWVNRTIATGAVDVYSVFVEIAAQQPPKVTFTDVDKANKLLRGTVLDDNIGALTLYYKIDDEETHTIEGIVSNGVAKEFSIDISKYVCGSTHNITAYAKDSDNQQCSPVTYPLTIEHSYVDTVVTPATCTTKGVMKRTCSVCQHTCDSDIPIIPHTYDQGIVTKAPTCTTPGEKTVKCTVCGHTETIAIPALGHNYVNGKCSVCNASDTTATVAATVPTTKATGTDTGAPIPQTGSAASFGVFAAIAGATALFVTKRKKNKN